MMINLKKSKKEFCIVFRTYFNDIDTIIREYNKFCQGEHPCYNGKNNTPIARFDGSKGTRNYIINESHYCKFYRYDKAMEKAYLVSGKVKEKIDKSKNIEEEYEKEIDDETVKIEKGGQEAYEKMNILLSDRCTLAIRDDFDFYLQNNRKSDAGKLLVIDQAEYNTQHIFFDDKISEDEKCIVDVKDLIEGTSVPIKKSINKYLYKVDIIDVLKDPDYFTKAIELCEKARMEEIEKIEKGLTEDVSMSEQIKKSDFEILQELPDEEYLRRTILPLLHPALKLVDLERPNDPIGFIAMYCLKN